MLLQRTAEATVSAPDKYLRLGVDNAEELLERIPDDARGAVQVPRRSFLGAIEASAFTPEQQRMLEDFVDVRGGGLLALGGPRSFAEGGWAGTPLGDALPVALDRGSREPPYPPVELVVEADADRRESSVDADYGQGGRRRRRSGATCRRSRRSIRCVEAKPGATVLLTGVDEKGPRAGRARVPAVRPRQGAGACPCRTPGCGGCTRRWTSKDTTHFTRSGSGWRAGWWTACPIACGHGDARHVCRRASR